MLTTDFLLHRIEELFGNYWFVFSRVPIATFFRVLEDSIVEVVLQDAVDITQGQILVAPCAFKV